MSNRIFFIDTKYSNYLIASRPLKAYAAENILDYDISITKSQYNLSIKSNLVGLTGEILNRFICQKTYQGPMVVGILDDEPCIICSDDTNLDINNLKCFDDIVQKHYTCFDLAQYPLKLLSSVPKLCAFEQEVQDRLRKNAIDQGVFLQDASTTYLAFDTEFDDNIFIEPNVYFGSNVKLHKNVHIKAFSYLQGVDIHAGSIIGPFARVRGDTIIGANVKIGNFVEIKNSVIEISSKISHLSYIGDTKIGINVNIGAGVVTCNYDGLQKHQTIIEENVFIGSNSSLIAPLTIGANSLIGASSFINRDVPSNSFASARSTQTIKPNKRR